jgi:hypothetical protein
LLAFGHGSDVFIGTRTGILNDQVPTQLQLGSARRVMVAAATPKKKEMPPG